MNRLHEPHHSLLKLPRRQGGPVVERGEDLPRAHVEGDVEQLRDAFAWGEGEVAYEGVLIPFAAPMLRTSMPLGVSIG
jgi:hypothetical protein